jgi:hypothetical protein
VNDVAAVPSELDTPNDRDRSRTNRARCVPVNGRDRSREDTRCGESAARFVASIDEPRVERADAVINPTITVATNHDPVAVVNQCARVALLREWRAIRGENIVVAAAQAAPRRILQHCHRARAAVRALQSPPVR